MKKYKNGLAVFAVVVAVMLAVRLCAGFLWNGMDDYFIASDFVNKFELAIRSKNLTVTMIEDTHGGFHNDGDSLYRFDLNGQRPIVEGEEWHDLPVEDSVISRALTMDEFGERNLLDSIPCLRESCGGKWRLIMRSDDWMNWSLCVYDEGDNCFYLYEQDL